jgi:hypothetical protein
MGRKELTAKAQELGLDVQMRTSAELKEEIECELQYRRREEARIARDPFLSSLKRVEEEHVRQMKSLQQENAALKQRLDAMVNSTWNLGKTNDQGLYGQSSVAGEVSLVCGQQIPGQVMWNAPTGTQTKENKEARPGVRGNFNLRPAFGNLEQAIDTWENHLNHKKMEEKGDLAGSSVTSMTLKGSSTDAKWQEVPSHSLIISPTGSVRFGWEMFGMFLLAFDCVAIPVTIFVPSDNIYLTIASWATLLYWTCDVLVQFLTGYIHKGVSIMDQKRIVRHYLRGYFIFDMAILVPDWIFTLLTVGSTTSTTRLSRIIRIGRMLRLIRAAKMRKLLQRATDHIDTEEYFLMFSIFRVLTFVIIINHLAAGVFYFIGDIYNEESAHGDHNWIDAYNIESRLVIYQYVTAYRWSLSNFGLSSSSVQPQNTLEAIFAVVLLVLGMLTFTLFGSMVTTFMVQLSQRGDMHKQLWLLRRFFRQHHVPYGMSYRILRYLEYKIESVENKVSENSIDVLRLLSGHLMREFRYEVSYSYVRGHPMFEVAERRDQQAWYQLADKCYGEADVSASECLFHPKAEISQLYFVASGSMIYTQLDGEHTPCELGDWLGEHALWVDDWTSRGKLTSMSHSRVVTVSIGDFITEVRHNGDAWPLVVAYGTAFVTWLLELDTSQLTDLLKPQEDSSHEEALLTRAITLLDASQSSEEDPNRPRANANHWSRTRR